MTNRFEYLLQDVINKGFQDLKTWPMIIRFVKNTDYIMAHGFIFSLNINRLILKRKSIIYVNTCYDKLTDTAIKGCFAHELCHLIRDKELSFLSLLFRTIINKFSPGRIEKEERLTDELVIERGFGKELLQLARREPANGLTAKEIKQLIH